MYEINYVHVQHLSYKNIFSAMLLYILMEVRTESSTLRKMDRWFILLYYTIWWISLGKMTLSLLASSNTVGTSTLMPIFGVGFWGVKLFQFFSRLVLLIVSVRKSGKGKEYVLKLLFILILLTVSSIHITLRVSCFQIFLQRVLYKRSA